MLSSNDIKEQLSLAYLHAVASRAGFSIEEIRKDRDSIDLKVCARGLLADDAVLTSPELAIQLNATARAQGSEDSVSGVAHLAAVRLLAVPAGIASHSQ